MCCHDLIMASRVLGGRRLSGTLRLFSPFFWDLVTAADLRPARSYSSSPSSTQMVVWNEERRLGGRFGDKNGHASQFQPPSSSCSPRSCLASASFGSLKYEPMPRILPLMHGSVSPCR